MKRFPLGKVMISRSLDAVAKDVQVGASWMMR